MQHWSGWIGSIIVACWSPSATYHRQNMTWCIIDNLKSQPWWLDSNNRVSGIPGAIHLEPRFEKIFHPNSFGYRPGRSAKEAVAQARTNCWHFDWVLDLDIKAFFDTIDHDLLMRAVEKHVPEKWIRLYIKRWLETPVLLVNGELETCTCGSPQGAVISPLLANLYLHYAFDQWMRRQHPGIPFERYADDVV